MTVTRRSFIAMTAALPFALSIEGWAKNKSIPIGIEMYSVRDDLKKDPQGTVRAIAAMGYQGLEFYAPYFDWSEDETKQMKKLLDDLGIRCFSTHNDVKTFGADTIEKVRDRNLMLGSKYVVQAYSEPKATLDQWKMVADVLNATSDKLETSGLKVGFHNHDAEFRPVEGMRPIEFLAKNTKKSVMLQLDVGTCIEAGADPVGWIKANPGRIRSLHLKDWSTAADKGFKVLFGEGAANWKAIFDAAESVGGAEYLLMEQEGSQYSQMQTAKLCLENYKKMFERH